MIKIGISLLVAISATLVFAAAEPTAEKARLTIKVTDIRNRDGQLIFGVFQSSKGFPTTQKNAINWQVTSIDKDEMIFTAELPPGDYAASVLHDENKNNEMDTNIIGIPNEGYGVTNNPKPKFRGAKFKEALFTLPKEGAEMTISLQYF